MFSAQTQAVPYNNPSDSGKYCTVGIRVEGFRAVNVLYIFVKEIVLLSTDV